MATGAIAAVGINASRQGRVHAWMTQGLKVSARAVGDARRYQNSSPGNEAAAVVETSSGAPHRWRPGPLRHTGWRDTPGEPDAHRPLGPAGTTPPLRRCRRLQWRQPGEQETSESDSCVVACDACEVAAVPFGIGESRHINVVTKASGHLLYSQYGIGTLELRPRESRFSHSRLDAGDQPTLRAGFGGGGQSWGQHTTAQLEQLSLLKARTERVFFIPFGGEAELHCERASERRDRDEGEGDVGPDFVMRADAENRRARRRELARSQRLAVRLNSPSVESRNEGDLKIFSIAQVRHGTTRACSYPGRSSGRFAARWPCSRPVDWPTSMR